MAIFVRQRELQATLGALQPDETLSSWASSNAELVELQPDRACQFERDYGALELDLPSASSELRAALHCASQTPDVWMLEPFERTQWCGYCLAEATVAGHRPYRQRAWDIASRTCCRRHGRLLDTNIASHDPSEIPFDYYLRHRPWHGEGIGTPRALLIYSDRRAIHLEQALEEGKGAAWFPTQLGHASLREVYIVLVNCLMRQLHQAHLTAGSPPLNAFTRLPNYLRFSINVMVEAILSHWSATPLPTCATPARTRVIVKAIGWDPVNAPPAKDQVRFRIQDVSRPDPQAFAEVANLVPGLVPASTSQPSSTLTLTWPEARCIGYGPAVRAMDGLRQLTQAGRLGRLDERRGRLVQVESAIPLSEVERQYICGLDIELPTWARAKVSRERRFDSSRLASD